MSETRMTQLKEHLSRRILIKDGAIGTMTQAKGLQERDFRSERFDSTIAIVGGQRIPSIAV